MTSSSSSSSSSVVCPRLSKGFYVANVHIISICFLEADVSADGSGAGNDDEVRTRSETVIWVRLDDDGQRDGRSDGQMDGWTDRRTDRQTNVRTDGWEDGRKNKRMNIRMDG